MRISILFFLIIIPLVFCIPVLLGIYVYRDAAKHGMNPVLWTLITILTPSLLGLIIYLLVRNNYSDLTCPNCGAMVQTGRNNTLGKILIAVLVIPIALILLLLLLAIPLSFSNVATDTSYGSGSVTTAPMRDFPEESTY